MINKKLNIFDDVSNLNAGEEEQAAKRQETIAKLKVLRRRTIKLIISANKILANRQAELESLNKLLCEVQGHTFTDWEIHNGFCDRTWYYTRNCEVCGKKEQQEDEPKDFEKTILKRK